MSRRKVYAAFALALLLLECLIATRWRNFPTIRGSLGDFLAVIFLYCLLQALKPHRPLFVGLGVFAFACLLELGQDFHLADRLSLPRGGLLHTLLGSTFSVCDILMYALGVVTVVALDHALLSPLRLPYSKRS